MADAVSGPYARDAENFGERAAYHDIVVAIEASRNRFLGLEVYKNIKDIPGIIDSVSITVPAKFVLDAVRDCAAKKVKNIQIISFVLGPRISEYTLK